MSAWLNRNDHFPDWLELLPYVGQTVTVDYRRWEHHRWSARSGCFDERSTGVLQAVDDDAVTVGGERLPYEERFDGLIWQEITTIRLGGAAAISAEQLDALAREEAYVVWERAGRPWLSQAEQERMYFQALETVRRRREPPGVNVVYQHDWRRLERPEITDADLMEAKLHPASHVPSWCVRADGEH